MSLFFSYPNMNVNQNIETINNFKALVKKENDWFFQNDELEESYQLEIEVDSFLLLNTQFVRISPFVIINLNSVENYLFTGTSGFFIISNKRFDIPRRFVSKVKAAHKLFLSQKYSSCTETNKGTWISRGKNQSKTDSNCIGDDVKNIKYFVRKGTQTLVYFNDGQKKVFYETLAYFEERLDVESPFLRICRTCIINIKYINSCKINSETKTGEVEIDSLNFDISRRLLPSFKRKVKKNNLTFLVQKRV